jgi:hypothetical protein
MGRARGHSAPADTLTRLHKHRGSIEDGLVAFANAEASIEDPIQTRHVAPAPAGAKTAPKRFKGEALKQELSRRSLARLAVTHKGTYDVRAELKELGCLWEPGARKWMAPDEATLKECLQLCAKNAGENASAIDPEIALAASGRRWLSDEIERGEVEGRDIAVGDVIDREDRKLMVVGVETPRYLNRDAIEAMYGGWGAETMRPGYRTRYTAREVSLLEAESERLAALQAREAARERRDELAREVKSNGERPDGEYRPEGERLFDTGDAYGGGEWWVVGDGSPEQPWIWHVQNNGGDGDFWGANNVSTGGAGAIGSRVPWTPELAQELAALRATLETKES